MSEEDEADSAEGEGKKKKKKPKRTPCADPMPVMRRNAVKNTVKRIILLIVFGLLSNYYNTINRGFERNEVLPSRQTGVACFTCRRRMRVHLTFLLR